MTAYRSSRLLMALGATLATFAFAQGTIDTTGAVLEPGSAEMKGTVTVDPCAPGGTAPALPPLGVLGTIAGMTGSLPPFPGGGSGADGAFRAMTSQTLPGGTYNFTTYGVDVGVVVTYSGP